MEKTEYKGNAVNKDLFASSVIAISLVNGEIKKVVKYINIIAYIQYFKDVVKSSKSNSLKCFIKLLWYIKKKIKLVVIIGPKYNIFLR